MFYSPGGTICLIQCDLNARKIKQGGDTYGHWSYVKLSASDNRIITITMVYQPCKASDSTGTTACHQQLALQQSSNNRI
eukprot:7583024-Ditylum_brightwellii.AAC.1